MNQAKIYVGNLSFNTTEDQFRDFFSQFGEIKELNLISDYQTGRSKGFGFITYSSDEEGLKAVEEANGAELDGRRMNVNTAKEDRRRSGGGSRNGGGNRNYND